MLLLAAQAGGEAIVFDGSVEKAAITTRAAYLLDPSGDYQIDDVAALPGEAFTAVEGPILHLGITQTPLWVRFTVRNAHPAALPVLEFNNPRISWVDIYTQTPEGAFEIQRAGAEYPFYLQEIYHTSPAFQLPVSPGEERVFHLHIRNTGILRFWLTLWKPEAFYRYVIWANISNLLVVGALAALCAFNLIVFVTLRERGYLYLALFVLVYLFTHMASTGIGAMLLWPDTPWMGERGPSTLIMLCFGMSALFASSMLPLRMRHSLWHRVGLVLGLASVLGAAVAIFAPGITRICLLVPMAILLPAYMFVLGFVMWKQDVPFARLFILTWGTLCAASVLASLVVLRLFEYPGRGEHHLALIFIGASLLWCFALTGRVRQREIEVRTLLEAQVRDRTQALEDAKQELLTLSGLLPMCARCKKVRDDSGYWKNVDTYLREHTGLETSHGICPDCMVALYPEFVARQAGRDSAGPGKGA
jgi:hypothetical protein